MARVLIVDDDPICRAVVAEALSQAGHACEEAEDGDVALERLRAAPADLVITDMLMPNRDGIETILELRKRWPATRIIGMSAGSSYVGPDQLLGMAGRLGADATLVKPIRAGPLLEAVARVLKP